MPAVGVPEQANCCNRVAPTMTELSNMRRILYVVSSAMTARKILGPQLTHVAQAVCAEVTVVSAPGSELGALVSPPWVSVVEVPLEREISLLRDGFALFRLFRLMRSLRPDLVNSGTPKAGLLGGLAAWLARVPCRIYTLRGLRLETTTGLKRLILTLAERTSCRCAQRVVCVSESLRKRCLELRLATANKVVVIASSNGVDAERFGPSNDNLQRARVLARELGIPCGVSVVGFVGRLTRDKGISELVSAFVSLADPELRLLLVGDYEPGDPLPVQTRQTIETSAQIIKTGFVADPAPYYHLMTVVALPTYREGFPSVVLQAAAAGKPVLATVATGAVDAVVDGVTGILVPLRQAEALAKALHTLLRDRPLMERLGRNARDRVLRDFEPGRVWGQIVSVYQEMLEGKTRRCPCLYLALKRIIDVAAAAVGLGVLFPLLLLIGIGVRATGKTVLFRQKRPGLDERPFTALKFRTMTDAKSADGTLLPDSARLTAIGKLLRSLSLDELPQLWNVLKGDMSLVGPRPLLPEYLPRYSPRQRRRHEVKPGITGWAQVNGRNALTWEEKLELDVWYVDHQGFWLDLKILSLTLLKVFRRDGISQPGHATMPEFMGTPEETKTA